MLVSCLLGNLFKRDTCFFGLSQLFLQFRDAHFSGRHYFSKYLSKSLAVSLKKRHAAFACLPLRPTGILLPWMKASFAAGIGVFRVLSGHGGAFAILPGTKCHAPNFANFPALLPSYTDSPTIVFCLPRSGPYSLLCQKGGKYHCLLSSSTSGCTLERPLHFLAPSSAPRPRCPIFIWTQLSR